jgi:hypothetical protein
MGPEDADFDRTTVPATTDDDDDDPLGGDASGSSGALSNGGADAEEPTPDTEPLGVVADDPADADAETADADSKKPDAETPDAADAGESGIDETPTGPSDGDAGPESASDDPLADPDATDASVAAASTAPAPTADTEDAAAVGADGDQAPDQDSDAHDEDADADDANAAETPGDDAMSGDDALAGSAVAAATGGVGGPRAPVVDAERSVAPTDPAPGDSVTVSVVARDVSGHVVLRESVPGTGGRIESFDPAPLARTKDGRTVYVVWSLDEPTDVGMTYATNVPEDAAGGDRFTFEGSVETPDGESSVGGDAECRVITPFLERLRGDGSVADDDVAEAADLAAGGDLTGEAFEEVYREWLADREADVARPQFDGGDGDGGDGDR